MTRPTQGFQISPAPSEIWTFNPNTRTLEGGDAGTYILPDADYVREEIHDPYQLRPHHHHGTNTYTFSFNGSDGGLGMVRIRDFGDEHYVDYRFDKDGDRVADSEEYYMYNVVTGQRTNLNGPLQQ